MDNNKRKEIIEKGASALEGAAKKADELVNKRTSILGELSPAVTLGLIAVLVVAVAQNLAGMLVIFAIGLAAGLAPKILKMVLAKKAEMDAKKADKSVSSDKKE